MSQSAVRRFLIPCLGVALAAPLGAFEPSGLLEIHVLNVQHNAAMLVIGPDGTRVLMDAGKASMIDYLQDGLGLYAGDHPPGGTDFDYSIASHLDADHIRTFVKLKNEEGYSFGVNYFNDSGKTNATIEAYKGALHPIALPIESPPAYRELGRGARMHFLASKCRMFTDPLHDVPDCTTANRATGCCRPGEENDLSTAVLITYGDFEFLWAGDLSGSNNDEWCTTREYDSRYGNMETPLAVALTSGPGALLGSDGVDVLHVSHHGADSATNMDWMNHLRPEVAVIPTGPSDGDPEPGVVDMVLHAEATTCPITAPAALVYQTDASDMSDPEDEASEAGYMVGNIIIETDGVFYGIGGTGTTADGVPLDPGDMGEVPTFLLTDENAPDCPLEATVAGPLLIDDAWTWKGLHSLKTEGSVRVGAGGSVKFQAGSHIALGDGFQVDAGGDFQATVAVVLDCSEPWPPEAWALSVSAWD